MSDLTPQSCSQYFYELHERSCCSTSTHMPQHLVYYLERTALRPFFKLPNAEHWGRRHALYQVALHINVFPLVVPLLASLSLFNVSFLNIWTFLGFWRTRPSVPTLPPNHTFFLSLQTHRVEQSTCEYITKRYRTKLPSRHSKNNIQRKNPHLHFLGNEGKITLGIRNESPNLEIQTVLLLGNLHMA